MSLNAWIGLSTVLVPALALVAIGGVVHICLWVIGDGRSGHTARDRSESARRLD